MLPAFQAALEGTPSGLFCDSLEIDSRGLWSPALWDEFARERGYRLEPLSDDLDRLTDVRYDYRKFLARVMVREFYAPFTEFCHDQGAYSRVQCHGSPTDLLTCYSAVDVPESEALLFDPPFSRIPASAAALSDRAVVSAETFTCIYGFTSPRHIEAYRYWRREQVADLKLLADAVIANGVNQIVWHGMPYNGAGCHHEFYASVHVGPDCAFVDELPAFNAYLESVCGRMQSGRTVSELAVYLPNEDMWMLDLMPLELRTPGAAYWWEMRHVLVPEETRPFQPLWISAAMLARAEMREGRLAIGSQSFAALYLDVEWLDADGLAEIERLSHRQVSRSCSSAPPRPTPPPPARRLRTSARFAGGLAEHRSHSGSGGLATARIGREIAPVLGTPNGHRHGLFLRPSQGPPRSAIRCPTDFQNATRRFAAKSLCIRPRRRPTWNSFSSLTSLCLWRCPKKARSPRSIAGIAHRVPVQS